MANNEEHKKISMILSFLSIDLSCSDAGPELLHRSTPDFGIVSVNSSFLPQDIPRHPDAHLFEVREAFKRTLLLGFRAYIRAYIAFCSPPAPVWGRSNRRRSPCCAGMLFIGQNVHGGKYRDTRGWRTKP